MNNVDDLQRLRDLAGLPMILESPNIGDFLLLEFDDQLLEGEIIGGNEYTLLIQLDESQYSDFIAQQQSLSEAEYQGRTVTLGKPMKGDVKKFKVYVKDPKTNNVKKVNFGDPNMEIKRDDPARRKNFRARHGCGTARASDRTKAAYWSCRMWSKTPVSKILKNK